MAKRRRVNNLLGLAVLAFLMPGRPIHPYELAAMLRRTGKERDMKIKWGSFYTVIAEPGEARPDRGRRQRPGRPPARAHPLRDHRRRPGRGSGTGCGS